MSADLKELKRLALSTVNCDWDGVVRWYEATGRLSTHTCDYIEAADPATILDLLAQLEQAKSDAKRYQWLRLNGIADLFCVDSRGGVIADVLDDEIDKRLDLQSKQAEGEI